MANQPQQPDTALHNASHLMQYHDLIESIVAALDARDAYTASHSDRVADMVLVLAAALGLDEDETTRIHMAAHLHDIGKNLVKMMMEGKGLEVVDLGTDVAPETYVQTAVEQGCQIICCSALLTTTMGMMEEVVKKAEEAGIRDKVKIMVGGAPVTEAFCEQIGADKYTADAASAADAAVALCRASA